MARQLEVKELITVLTKEHEQLRKRLADLNDALAKGNILVRESACKFRPVFFHTSLFPSCFWSPVKIEFCQVYSWFMVGPPGFGPGISAVLIHCQCEGGVLTRLDHEPMRLWIFGGLPIC